MNIDGKRSIQYWSNDSDIIKIICLFLICFLICVFVDFKVNSILVKLVSLVMFSSAILAMINGFRKSEITIEKDNITKPDDNLLVYTGTSEIINFSEITLIEEKNLLQWRFLYVHAKKTITFDIQSLSKNDYEELKDHLIYKTGLHIKYTRRYFLSFKFYELMILAVQAAMIARLCFQIDKLNFSQSIAFTVVLTFIAWYSFQPMLLLVKSIPSQRE